MFNMNRALLRICHPASWRGSVFITIPYPGLTTWATESSALTGSKFLGLSARKIQFDDFLEVLLSHFRRALVMERGENVCRQQKKRFFLNKEAQQKRLSGI